ncbi:DegV family protein [Alicyclobacillus cycloheptanicus]|uniref:DegV family protein with EDD domain n=1 Tax=Alicyclobacillus cycloheptanicus TaxID=1457 RepID=A0ABT9XLB0_9BACL|nr:DegV family protein [Alicyclobacillus cycloheptanicus]MDQ0191096.1 DegV family protein with EDD domain [Alicyclobacillus cycloheptanicus]WDL99824.1 DegV family protein [Alicyclobacillus cycloheptanicus]
MTKIAFVTDSTAYLTPEKAEAFGITVVPLSVVFEGEVYREGVDISAADFYQRLTASKAFPTTSQPPVGEFVEVFTRLLETHDVVMCLLLSSKLSGTFESAQTAAQMVDGQVIVVDSRISSYGIAGPLLDGVQLAKAGGTPEEIQALWAKELDTMHAYFVVDTLEMLHRGGRIGGAAAVFGALLQIKPILTMRDGRIDLFEKVRTHKRAMERMLSEFDADARTGRRLKVGVVHAQRYNDAVALRDQLTSQYPNIETDISELGPVIGAHTGPGLLALVYYDAQD